MTRAHLASRRGGHTLHAFCFWIRRWGSAEALTEGACITLTRAGTKRLRGDDTLRQATRNGLTLLLNVIDTHARILTALNDLITGLVALGGSQCVAGCRALVAVDGITLDTAAGSSQTVHGSVHSAIKEAGAVTKTKKEIMEIQTKKDEDNEKNITSQHFATVA